MVYSVSVPHCTFSPKERLWVIMLKGPKLMMSHSAYIYISEGLWDIILKCPTMMVSHNAYIQFFMFGGLARKSLYIYNLRFKLLHKTKIH